MVIFDFTLQLTKQCCEDLFILAGVFCYRLQPSQSTHTKRFRLRAVAQCFDVRRAHIEHNVAPSRATRVRRADGGGGQPSAATAARICRSKSAADCLRLLPFGLGCGARFRLPMQSVTM